MKIDHLITSPTLLLDEKICRANIATMAKKAKEYGVQLRPHLKTPQSQEIASWLKAHDIHSITTSSLQMANYFMADGWKDITVAFPVNIREMDLINKLASQIQLNLVVENEKAVLALKKHLKYPVGIWLKVNLGNNRTGFNPDQTDEMQELINVIKTVPQLKAIGILGHAGQSYYARGNAAINQVHDNTLQICHQLKTLFPSLKISIGDTPTTSVATNFSGVDEIRPGNFFFYDLMQYQIGSCTIESIAVAMACPVVAKYPDRKEIVVHGGAVHFSKDHLLFDNGTSYYGLVCQRRDKDDSWQLLPAKAYLRGLSQEHGIIAAKHDFIQSTEIGSLLYILPIHSCLTANLMKEYLTLEGSTISMMPTQY